MQVNTYQVAVALLYPGRLLRYSKVHNIPYQTHTYLGSNKLALGVSSIVRLITVVLK